MLPNFHARHALLLQGPAGPFFSNFAELLRGHGLEVSKVNFNAGDELFFRGEGAVRFREPMENWPAFVRDLLISADIDVIFLFGDCRPLHKQAVRIARELGVPVWVFEEGYLRPDFITLERGGVNGHSSLPKDPEFYRRAVSDLPVLPKPEPVGQTFARSAWNSTCYSISATLLAWRYPHYRHHRHINAFLQCAQWCRGGVRKLWFRAREAGKIEELTGEWSKNYFFVPLQVHCDAQLQHSPFESMEDFIETVVSTFAEHAPKDVRLVLKHHPQDRPYRDYTRYLQDLGARYQCGHRIVYVHDLHLPTILKHARGVVTMNSTVGTAALHHGAPVKVLGEAIYDMPEMTSQDELADFFNRPGAVDKTLYRRFCRYLRETNQINGSFHRNVPALRPDHVLSGPEAVTESQAAVS